MTMLDNPDTLKKIQVVLIGLLAFGAVGYLMAGVYVYGIDSEQGMELWSDIKLIVIAGILAAFALLGLGRRASTDK